MHTPKGVSERRNLSRNRTEFQFPCRDALPDLMSLKEITNQ